jgi:oxygen-dependent protoporphyrinogen oxidase
MGSEMLTKLIDPFIAGTMASDPELAEAQAVLPRLTALEKKYGSITAGIVINKIIRRKGGATPDVFSFKNGMGTLPAELSHLLSEQIHYSTRGIAIEPRARGWQITAEQQNEFYGSTEIQIHAKQVVLAQPAKQASDIIAPLCATLSTLLASIDYAPLTVVHQGFEQTIIKQALNGGGFLLPKNEQQALLGNLWMSSLFTHRAPTGKVLLTSYLGGCRQPEVRNWSDEQCLEQTYIALNQYLSLKGDPEMFQLHRHSNALPLYHGAYLKKCTEIKQTLALLPGVHIVANYLDGISVRDRIMQALQVSDKINKNLISVNTSIISVNNTSTVVQRVA